MCSVIIPLFRMTLLIWGQQDHNSRSLLTFIKKSLPTSNFSVNDQIWMKIGMVVLRIKTVIHTKTVTLHQKSRLQLTFFFKKNGGICIKLSIVALRSWPSY